MAGFNSRALASINQIIDWFIPLELGRDREMRKQARLFLISHLFGPFIGNTVPLALYLFDPAPGYQVVVLALSITGFWVFPFVLRSFGHYNLLAMVSIQNLIFCILWSCYYYGGVTSPTLPWVVTIPLLAFFYIGQQPSLRLGVLAMFAVNVVGFFLIYSNSGQLHARLPFAALQGLGLVSTIAASMYVAMMALFYAKALASHAELESEVKEHRSTALELRRATEEAERAGSAKADFLAKMSHELRTPLNAVIGYSQILLEDATDEGDAQSIEDLNKIHGAGQHLLKIVNEVLDLSKIDAGKMELYNQPVDMAGLVADPVAQIRAAAERRGNKVVLLAADADGQSSDIAGDKLFCDIAKVQQALSQILDNAVKFTKDGTITVSAARSGATVAISVRDTGVGIAADQLPNLFQQFTVSGDASTSKYGGTGLGLALSRKLCLLMGGDLEVASTLGSGTCLTIRIPAVAEERNTEEPLALAA